MRRLNRVLAIVLMTVALAASACGSSDEAAVAVEPAVTAVEPEAAGVEPTAEPAEPTLEPAVPAESTVSADETPEQDTPDTQESPDAGEPFCSDIAALFVTAGSVNPSLADPQVSASCTGAMMTITANGIPDYTYIETSPGDPREQDLTFVIPVTATPTTEFTDVPVIGPIGVALNGVPIYGPTEGQGGDVLAGEALSECGSHNGPGGFHIHVLGTSTTTDCIFTPEEVAASPQLFGYAVDGYPIYSGNDQYTPSWMLTNASLFATDTWAAHSYVEGSGDLDQCNGITDENGNYAYYTTDTFPYVIGCFAGEVDLEGSGAGGGGGRGAAAGGDDDGAVVPEGQAGGAGGGPDFTEAAAALGVSVEELEAALSGRPPDFAAAAATLGITLEELEAVLPAPPG